MENVMVLVSQLIVALLVVAAGLVNVFVAKKFAKLPVDTQSVILNWVQVAVDAAEQLYKNGTIDKDRRFEEAVNRAQSLLATVGITITDKDLQTIIEGLITGLPKTTGTTTTGETDANQAGEAVTDSE